MDYDQPRRAEPQQWTNNDIQTSDAGAFIYIPMPPPSQYPTTKSHELSESAYDNGNDFIAQRNHAFANRPAKKSIIQRTLAPQTIPSSVQYSAYDQSSANGQAQYPYQQQQPHYYTYQPTKQSVDEYLLHHQMPLPRDQTYIVSNALLDMPRNVEPDYLT